MSRSEAHKKTVRDYYTEKAAVYASTYTGEGRYRSNHFRLRTIMKLLEGMKPQPKKILEAGCGDARVVREMALAGYDCRGVDNHPAMLEIGRGLLEESGLNPGIIGEGDVYALGFNDRSFDVLVCAGVLSLLPDHAKIFAEFRRVLKKSGRIIFSVENGLFDLFTANKFTVGFYAELFEAAGVPGKARNEAVRALAPRFAENAGEAVAKPMEFRQIKSALERVGVEKYNPLNLAGKLETHGFRLEQLRFYHYHPLPPRFEKDYPELFREHAESMETTEYDWRGGLLCSAMLAQAAIA